ncbi:hypothetical protein LA345_36815 (plasmid) [Burkholderia vietnamiensis]|nr:hypothetical protein [Burkholderia vietnamiensis]
MMRKLGDWLAGVILFCIVASDVRSVDPVIAAQKRAVFGIIVSMISSAVFCGCAVAILPDEPSSPGVGSLTAVFQRCVAAGFSLAALAASVAGIYFLVRYVLVLKWPERFVDLSE